MMADNFYEYLNSGTSGTVVQDEALMGPWTHRITLYCDNPSKQVIDDLRAIEGLVGCFVKTKEAPSKK